MFELERWGTVLGRASERVNQIRTAWKGRPTGRSVLAKGKETVRTETASGSVLDR